MGDTEGGAVSVISENKYLTINNQLSLLQRVVVINYIYYISRAVVITYIYIRRVVVITYIYIYLE